MMPPIGSSGIPRQKLRESERGQQVERERGREGEREERQRERERDGEREREKFCIEKKLLDEPCTPANHNQRNTRTKKGGQTDIRKTSPGRVDKEG